MLLFLEPVFELAHGPTRGDRVVVLFAGLFRRPLAAYSGLRAAFFVHPVGWGLAALAGAVVWLLLIRTLLSLYNDKVRPRILGLSASEQSDSFAFKTVTLPELTMRAPARAPGDVVVGETPDGEVYVLPQRKRATHTHVLGRTGSGKTESVLLPMMFQDIQAGGAVVFIDAKGSSENLEALVSMAYAAGRLDDVKIFSLAYPDHSHTYNPAYPVVRDALSTAQMVFNGFTMDHPYYRGQSQIYFQNLMLAAHALGEPFHLGDISLAVTDVRIRDELEKRVTARDRAVGKDHPDYGTVQAGVFALRDVRNQLNRLGNKADEVFTGLDFNLRQFAHRLLLANNPDIRVQEDLANKKILYFQLPRNLYMELAPAIGKIVLQQIQQVGALRQVDRTIDQTPVTVYVDEFYNFAYEGFITGLNMLRDARISFVLAHQDMSDLERVSKEFARGVVGNTGLKIILYQLSHTLAEDVAKTIGTSTDEKPTNQRVEGALLTKYVTGAASLRDVEAFLLHPNRIKKLHPFGQAYIVYGTEFAGVNLPRFSPPPIPAGLKPTFARNVGVDGLNFAELLAGGAARTYDHG